MHLDVIQSLSIAGDSSKANDDRAGAGHAHAWVIDGATDLGEPGLLGNRGGAAWIAAEADRAFTAAPEDGSIEQTCRIVFEQVAARFAEQPWSAEDHVLRAHVDAVAAVADELADLVTDDLLEHVTGLVPDDWLVGGAPPDEMRAAYRAFLRARLDGSRAWLPKRGAA